MSNEGNAGVLVGTHQDAGGHTAMRQPGSSLEVQTQAAELKLWDEQKMGELLEETVNHEGERPEEPLRDERDSTQP
ncbi:MAG: hypothetical protein VST68_02540 [Nitrospirota bacterium]|nr:hypothetical protein [Nitrospirota bacterium]